LIEKLIKATLEGLLPSHGSNNGYTLHCLDEMSEERCFSLNVQEPHLSRGPEVISLDKKENDCQDWDGYGEIFTHHTEDDKFHSTVCQGFELFSVCSILSWGYVTYKRPS
jgi:hypothetical protein